MPGVSRRTLSPFHEWPGRARAAYDGMAPYLHVIVLAAPLAVVGGLLLSRVAPKKWTGQRLVGVGRPGQWPSGRRRRLRHRYRRHRDWLVGTVDRVTEFPALAGWWIVAMWAVVASGASAATRHPEAPVEPRMLGADAVGRYVRIASTTPRSAWRRNDAGAQCLTEHRRSCLTPRFGHDTAAIGIPQALRWWPVLVPVVIVLVGAWLYRWVDEDAFINFRIIDNLLAGHGLVFNLGERVEVDSDPLWLFTLTGLHEILPFMALEWLSVFLGLVCTAAGFLTGGRAIQRLAFSRNESTVFPLGLLVVSVVAGVWEFATSGLEMSMVFLWLGASFLLLVRVEGRRSRAVPAAVVMGLGSLIRPELALGSVVFMVALLLVMAAPGWSGTPRRVVRYGRSPRRRPGPPGRLRDLPHGLLRPGGSQHRAGQGRGCRLVVAGIHLPVELRVPLHPVAAHGVGRALRVATGPRLVEPG